MHLIRLTSRSRRVTVTATGALLVALGACNRHAAVECTAESAQAPVITIVKEQLERLVSKETRGGEGEGHTASLSKIRATIAQLTIGIDDIRTSKVDPNSTKRFCAGTLRVRFPADTLTDADQARQVTGLPSVSDVADNADVERNADSFTSTVEFNVQPTDDGSKVFAQLESGDSMLGFVKEVLASALARAQVQENERAQAQATDQAAAEQNAALTEQRNANLASAKTDNQLAAQTIAAAWKAIPTSERADLLPLQRAWIRKKDADCAVEAASASTDVTERESARLVCDTRATQERIGVLGNFRGEERPTDDTMMANDSQQ